MELDLMHITIKEFKYPTQTYTTAQALLKFVLNKLRKLCIGGIEYLVVEETENQIKLRSATYGTQTKSNPVIFNKITQQYEKTHTYTPEDHPPLGFCLTTSYYNENHIGAIVSAADSVMCKLLNKNCWGYFLHELKKIEIIKPDDPRKTLLQQRPETVTKLPPSLCLLPFIWLDKEGIDHLFCTVGYDKANNDLCINVTPRIGYYHYLTEDSNLLELLTLFTDLSLLEKFQTKINNNFHSFYEYGYTISPAFAWLAAHKWVHSWTCEFGIGYMEAVFSLKEAYNLFNLNLEIPKNDYDYFPQSYVEQLVKRLLQMVQEMPIVVLGDVLEHIPQSLINA